jgi:hypothetical protein
VEGGEGDDGVEAGALRLPGLELRIDDARLRDVALRERGEVRAELDRGDVEAALHEGARRLAGAGADLEDARAERGDVVDQLRRIRRPRAVVELGDGVEGRAELHAGSMPPEGSKSTTATWMNPGCERSVAPGACFQAGSSRCPSPRRPASFNVRGTRDERLQPG